MRLFLLGALYTLTIGKNFLISHRSTLLQSYVKTVQRDRLVAGNGFRQTQATLIAWAYIFSYLDFYFSYWFVFFTEAFIKLIMYSLLQSFVNPEDLVLNKVPEPIVNDPDVERVRRAHLNDLENIIPYLLIALAYIATGPNAMVARLLFRFAATSRIIHTLVYAFCPVPQPTRAIAFFLTFGITLYMIFHVVAKTVVYV